ncbi:MAG TPA: hypothetical protein VEZ11_17745 [Thermoanaerobaculia bacterium]|nr:hypothetical protein [Thermoanaerobaculia bacterium]
MTRVAAFAIAASLVAAAATAQISVGRVIDDAKALDRIAEMSRRDLPRDLMRRIVNEDIEILRGGRLDGSYLYASWERLEKGRVSDSFQVQPADRDDRLSRLELKGDHVYRVILDSPARRLLVARNHRVWVDRVDVEMIPEGTSAAKVQSFKVESWIEPGALKPVDLPEIARQATVRVFVRADREAGPANLGLILVQAKVVDNTDSPYADAVTAEKSLLRTLDTDDAPSVRGLTARILQDLQPLAKGTAASRTIDVTAPAPGSTEQAAPADAFPELQAIEDLLTGSDAERREGLDRLHQLLRRLRPK